MQNDGAAVSPCTNMAYRYENTFPRHLHKLRVVCGNVLFFPTCALFIYFAASEKHRSPDLGRWATLRGAHLRGRKQPSHRRPVPAFPEKRLRWSRVERLTGGPGGCCGFISQDCFVTKWAWCEYHLDTTYLKLARVPWLPAWQPRDGNKLHHLLNMHLTWCLLKNHG